MSNGQAVAVRPKTEVAVQGGDIYVNYLLDRTGSMAAIWDAAVEGYNGFKNEQARQPGTAFITLTAFDKPMSASKADVLVVQEGNAADLFDLRDEVYPRGMTPLLDAIGIAIENTEDWLVSHPDFSGKVLVVINTDGQENASTEFSLEGIKKAIERKQKEGWEFVFAGAGIDAFAEAAGMGISRDHTISYARTDADTRRYSQTLSESTSSMRTSGDNFEWKEPKEKQGE